MDVALMSDTVPVTPQQCLGFARQLPPRPNLATNGVLTLTDFPADPSAGPLQVSAGPPVKTRRRNSLRKKRRTRRRLYSGDEPDGGGQEYMFCGGGDDGLFGGAGGGWGSGGGWNFDRFEGQNWDESSWFSSSEFAYGFVYEVVCWIALLNCIEFAFKRLVKMVAGEIAGADREEKVPVR